MNANSPAGHDVDLWSPLVVSAGAKYTATVWAAASAGDPAWTQMHLQFLDAAGRALTAPSTRGDEWGLKKDDTTKLTKMTLVGQAPTGAVTARLILRSKATGAKSSAVFADAQVSSDRRVAEPAFDPAGAVLPAPGKVSMTCVTAGASIHYTMDGSEPTLASPLYTLPISVPVHVTLLARSFKSDLLPSPIHRARTDSPTALSITSNHTTVVHKHSIAFSGHIASSQPKNTHVKVYAKKPGSSTWTYLSTRHTTSTHHWSYSYAPSSKGTWYFQVRFAGTSTSAAGTSSDRRVTVK